MSGFGIQKKGTSPLLVKAGSPGPVIQPLDPSDFTGPKLPENFDEIMSKSYDRIKKSHGGKIEKSMTPKIPPALKKSMTKIGLKKGGMAATGKGKALMKKGGLLKIAKQLKKSSKLHGRQSNIIKKMIKEVKDNG